MKNPKATLIFFHCGKVNIVGVKEEIHIKEALDKVYPIVVKNQYKSETSRANKKEVKDFDNIKRD